MIPDEAQAAGLSARLLAWGREADPYEYADAVEDEAAFLAETAADLLEAGSKAEGIVESLVLYVEENDNGPEAEAADLLIEDVDTFIQARRVWKHMQSEWNSMLNE